MPFLVIIWCFPELCNAFVVVDSAMLRFWGVPEVIEHYIPRTGITKKTIFDENSARLITVRNPFNFDLILAHIYLISVCEF